MISKLVLLLVVFTISLASHANEESCDWLLLSEQATKSEQAIFSRVSERWQEELLRFRQIVKKADRVEFLKNYSSQVQRKLTERLKRPAIHYNLHGGRWLDYLKSGGIKATRGDSGIQYGMSRDYQNKVYFFNLENISLYEVLTTNHPEQIFFRMRMGDTAIVFDLDAPVLVQYKSQGLITEENEITFNFGSAQRGHFYGVPYSSFLTHPLRLFAGHHKASGPYWVSYDEKTLYALIMVEESLN